MECFIIVTVLWVFSVCLHEFGHAWAAYCGGDYTVKDKGYLTLNPIHYTHPVYSLVMPVVFMILGGIGLPGGAVYIEHRLLRSRAWETWVSLAGIAMNLALVWIISLFFKFGLLKHDPLNLASVSLSFLLQLEVSAIILNLIPIPPLDGFQAIAPWLPPDVRERMFAVSNSSQWILFLVLWYVQPVNELFWHVVNVIVQFFGVDPYMGSLGYDAYRFWTH
ncbi:MAG TPA: site-2 protease family protein [Verrucomicrobiae bacterium]|jgi:Zn-dependent protease|nr:site-2 protease family protein [Verrucomicrobiae bacterium]